MDKIAWLFRRQLIMGGSTIAQNIKGFQPNMYIVSDLAASFLPVSLSLCFSELIMLTTANLHSIPTYVDSNYYSILCWKYSIQVPKSISTSQSFTKLIETNNKNGGITVCVCVCLFYHFISIVGASKVKSQIAG